MQFSSTFHKYSSLELFHPSLICNKLSLSFRQGIGLVLLLFWLIVLSKAPVKAQDPSGGNSQKKVVEEEEESIPKKGGANPDKMPPKKNILPGEEEEIPSKSKGTPPSKEEPVKGNKSAQEPESLSLADEALRTPRRELQKFYQSLAIPHDRIINTKGRLYRTSLIPTRKISKDAELEFLDLNSSLTSGKEKKMKGTEVRTFQPFEAYTLEETRNFLARTLDGVERIDQLDAAIKALSASLRFHQAAVEKQKRTGNDWQDLIEETQTLQQSIFREMLSLYAKEKKWDKADALSLYLGNLYPDNKRIQQEIYRLQLLRAEDSLKSSSETDFQLLRDTLVQYESQLNGAKDELVTRVRERLRTKAEEEIKKAKELAKKNLNSQAIGQLRNAAALDPDTPGIADLRTQLRDKILYIAVPSLPEMLSPATARFPAERWAIELMMESLVDSLPDDLLGYTFKPMLASRLPQVIPIGRRIQLTPNIMWGTKESTKGGKDFLDVRDVRSTLEFLQSHRAFPYAEGSEYINTATRIESPLRFDLVFRQGLLQPLQQLRFKVMPMQILMKSQQDPTSPEFSHRPIGSGPYRYEGREKDGERDSAVFRANPYYSLRPGKFGLPIIPEIRFVVPQTSTMLGDFQTNQLHFYLDVPTREFINVRENPRLLPVVRCETCKHNRQIWMLAINHRQPNLKEADIRRGLSMIIDRNAILNDIFRVEGTKFHQPLTGPFPPNVWATPSKSKDLYQLEVGKQLLANWLQQHASAQLTLKFPDGDGQIAQCCQKIKDQIEAATAKKIEIVLQSSSPENFYREVRGEHNFDLAYMPYEYRDDLYNLDNLIDPTACGRFEKNFLGYLGDESAIGERDRRLRQLLAEIRTHRDFDNAIKEKTHQLVVLFNQQMPFVPLWQLDRHMILSNNLQIHLEKGSRPLPYSLIEPDRLFTGVQNWKIK